MTQQQTPLICFTQMEQKNMYEQIKKPEIIVFAGPNGSIEYFYWQNDDWSKEKIHQLTGISL